MKSGTTHKTTKGYPRCTAGPLRNQYLHRIVAAAMLGRELRKDEEVHHKDQDRRNFWFTNLFILGSWDHGWVSAKQAYFMRTRDAREKQEWDDFMAEQQSKQEEQIAIAKTENVNWRPIDGELREAWENRNGSNARVEAV